MRGVKRNVALICGLLALGLMLITLGSASGIAAMFRGKPAGFEAKVGDGKLVLIQEGTWKEIAIKNLTSRENAGIIIIEGSSDGIHVKILTKEEREVQQPPMPADEELLEIAKRDERVRELIAEKDYRVVGRAVLTTKGKATASLLLEVEGKYYGIIIDLSDETVKFFKESPWLIILADTG
jgi:hypothetical protein